MTRARTWRNRVIGFVAAVATAAGLGIAGPIAAHAAAAPPTRDDRRERTRACA